MISHVMRSWTGVVLRLIPFAGTSVNAVELIVWVEANYSVRAVRGNILFPSGDLCTCPDWLMPQSMTLNNATSSFSRMSSADACQSRLRSIFYAPIGMMFDTHSVAVPEMIDSSSRQVNWFALSEYNSPLSIASHGAFLVASGGIERWVIRVS